MNPIRNVPATFITAAMAGFFLSCVPVTAGVVFSESFDAPVVIRFDDNIVPSGGKWIGATGQTLTAGVSYKVSFNAAVTSGTGSYLVELVAFATTHDNAARTDCQATRVGIVTTNNMAAASTTIAVHDGDNIIITPTDNFHGTDPGIDKVEVRIKRSFAGGWLFMRLNVASGE